MTEDRHERPQAIHPKRPLPGPDAPGGPAACVGSDARRRIGRDLRLLYGSILDQPLPERFARLIAELPADAEEREGSQ